MKKTILLVVLLMVILLSACVPTEPKDFLPFCQANYESLLVEYPNLPQSYIGACVSALASDNKAASYSALCNSQPLWDAINDAYNAGIDSRQDCIDFIHANR